MGPRQGNRSAERASPPSRRDHPPPSHPPPPGRHQTQRRRQLRQLPDQQVAPPGLPDRARTGPADRYRHHRRGLPPPCERQDGSYRRPLGTRRCRDSPQTTCPTNQRRLGRVLGLPPHPGTATNPPVPLRRQRHSPGGMTLPQEEPHPIDLGSDAIADLAAVIEQHFGVHVALSPMGTEADGLCVHSGPAALILASSDYPDGHLRFTLAHELGHHLLGDTRELIEEQEHQMFADTVVECRANAFAGHLLLPERGVESFLGWLGEGRNNLTDRGLVGLMEHFGVSHAALTVQLNMLEWLTYDEGRQLRENTRVHLLVAAHADVAPTGATSACAATSK